MLFDIYDIVLTVITLFTSTISIKAIVDKTISKEDRIIFIAVLVMILTFWISYVLMRIYL
jgi:hypothetical protein